MRGARDIVRRVLSRLPTDSVSSIVDIGLALGMQIPWTYEIAEKYGATLFSVDINLKLFFDKSIYRYLPPRGKNWSNFDKTSARYELGYEPISKDPVSWDE